MRKGKDGQKLAVLYEVITEDTSEERTSQRRRGEKSTPPKKPKTRQLELIPLSYSHQSRQQRNLEAAEPSTKWKEEDF